MRQLNGTDTAFLNLESNHQTMHIGALCLYDPSTTPSSKFNFKDTFDYINYKMSKLSIYREKLFKVPLNLDHAYWVDDENFDPKNHIKSISLPAPGDKRQLFALAADLHAFPLDLSRPPWEIYVIEGLNAVDSLPAGGYAILIKFHHGLGDGFTHLQVMSALHSALPEPETVETDPTLPEPESKPGVLDLLARAYVNNMMKPFLMASDLTKSTMASVKAMSSGMLCPPPVPPRTRFEQPISNARVFDCYTVGMDELKAARQAVEGATVTDVVLAVLGGAFRRYLESKGELPDKSLVANMPVNIRKKEEFGDGGNLITAQALAIRTDIANPVARLKAIHESSQQVKKENDAKDLRAQTDVLNHMYAMPLTSMVQLSREMKNFNRGEYNTAVSSQPVSSKPLYMNGAKAANIYALGPLWDGLSQISIPCGYADLFNFSVLACPDVVPDMDFYMQCIQKEFAQLKSAAAPKIKSSSNKPSKFKTAAAKGKTSKRKSKTTKKTSAKKRPGS